MRSGFLLDPDVVYLNHGSYGACSKLVFSEYQRLQLLAVIENWAEAEGDYDLLPEGSSIFDMRCRTISTTREARDTSPESPPSCP